MVPGGGLNIIYVNKRSKYISQKKVNSWKYTLRKNDLTLLFEKEGKCWVEKKNT